MGTKVNFYLGLSGIYCFAKSKGFVFSSENQYRPSIREPFQAKVFHIPRQHLSLLIIFVGLSRFIFSFQAALTLSSMIATARSQFASPGSII